MARRLLVIFLDALPHEHLKAYAPFLSSLGHESSLLPGLGFSINVFPELFAGLTPDAVGFFNKWGLSQSLWKGEVVSESSTGIALVRALVDRFTRRPQILSRGLHKIYGGITGKGNVANIPFSYLPFFEKNTKDSLPTPYIFEKCNLITIQHDRLSGSLKRRDRQAFAAALEEIRKGNDVFVTLGYLDAVGHLWGPDSDEFAQQIRQLDEWCRQLVDTFCSVHGEQANVVICSDHGMAAVEEGVFVDLQKYFGKPSLDAYFYFQDSVMLRVWVKPPALTTEIADYLDNLNFGALLTEAERKDYCIQRREFGDLIFVLDEGKLFWPGWYGGRFPAGMHGYRPELRSQQAIFIYYGNQTAIPLPSRSREVYGFIMRVIE